MAGTIIEVVNGGSLWLLIVDAGDRIAEQVVEPRYMADIVIGEGLETPHDLVGREIELSEDGLTVGLP